MKDLIAQQHELACCAINVAEVYAGMRTPETEKTGALLRNLEYVSISWEASRLAGHLRQEWSGNSTRDFVRRHVVANVDVAELSDA